MTRFWQLFLFIFLPIFSYAQNYACGALFGLDKYPAKIMAKDFYHDDLEGRVKYLKENERAFFKIHFKDGLIVDWEGKPISTGEGFEAMFVMGPMGDIYVEFPKGDAKLGVKSLNHHSSFLGGGAAAMAGGMRIKDGVLMALDNGSGHYAINIKFMNHVLDQFRQGGVSLSHVIIRDYLGNTYAESRIPQPSVEDFQQLTIHNLKASFMAKAGEIPNTPIEIGEAQSLMKSDNPEIRILAAKLYSTLISIPEWIRLFYKADAIVKEGFVLGLLDSKTTINMPESDFGALVGFLKKSSVASLKGLAPLILANQFQFGRAGLEPYLVELLDSVTLTTEATSYAVMLWSMLKKNNIPADEKLFVKLKNIVLNIRGLKELNDVSEVEIIVAYGAIFRDFFGSHVETKAVRHLLANRIREIEKHSQNSTARFEANRHLFGWVD